jgi:hypothetical protein
MSNPDDLMLVTHFEAHHPYSPGVTKTDVAVMVSDRDGVQEPTDVIFTAASWHTRFDMRLSSAQAREVAAMLTKTADAVDRINANAS